MRRLFALVLTSLSFVSASLYGQGIITGVVTDSFTGEPLPNATVYVNGTTNGTTTAEDGRFELKGVSYPATVVFSFVGYEPQAHDYYRNPGELSIKLKTSELPEIEVSGKIAKKDLTYFKRMFLGDDRWGRQATILNQNAIVIDSTVHTIHKQVETIRNTFRTEYLTNEFYTITNKTIDTIKIKDRLFTAWATEPLVIDLPLLGYILYVDLVKFSVRTTGNATSCDILGYFYYKPYENQGKRRQQRIEENRRRAYYGSSQHFLRSVYQNSLSENGYVISVPQTRTKGRRKIHEYIPIEVDTNLTRVADNKIQIHGLKDQTVRIRYYHEQDGAPLSYKGRGFHMYAESEISFLKDTCTFFTDGTFADNNIRFNGDISKKKVASYLPDDYALVIDTTKNYLKETENYTQDMLKYVDNIHNFNNMFPQEKVWLEFDNTAYFQGEDIWFKAFVTDATSLDQAPSQVLYVDFMAPTGQLLRQQKLKVVGGQADGRISLLDGGITQAREKQGILAYPSGFYEIRAYTQNMLDFSPEAIFSRVIPVYTQPKYVGEYDRSYVVTDYDNPLIKNLRSEPEKKQDKRSDYDIEFYPEGGNYICNVPNRVGFKVTGRDGFGMDACLIVPGIQDTVYTVHDGMGSFITDHYMDFDVVCITPGNKAKRHRIENTLSSGYSMIADMLSDSLLKVNIWRTGDLIGEPIAMAVTCRGDVIYFKEIKSLDNAQLMIDCSEWPAGVCRLTLFNREGMILSSRSIFHNNELMDGPIITVNTDSLSHNAFSKQVLEFKLTGKAGNPIHDHFCLSVRDASDYGGGQSDNLKTNLLLSSELRGYIHDPAWYLETYDDEHREALNLLTLIQGWERYEWQYMTGLQEFFKTHRIEENLTLNGLVLSYVKREPIPNINVYAALMPFDGKHLFETYDYQTDSTGYFGFDLADFYGRAHFSIHLMSNGLKGFKYETSMRMRLERVDRPKPRHFYKQETDLEHNTLRLDDYVVDYTDNDLTPAQRRKLGKMIDDVDIEDDAGKIRFVDYDTFTSFDAEEDTEFELDKGGFTRSLEDYLRARDIICGDYYSDMSLVEYIKRLITDDNWDTEGYMYIKPIIVVHNNNGYGTVPDASYIDMRDVKSVVIYDEPKYIWEIDNIVSNKYIDIRKNPEDESKVSESLTTDIPDKFTLIDVHLKEDGQRLFDWEKSNLSSRVTKVKGFSRPVQFYSPQYPDGPIPGEIDSRRTLYWNPNVVTDYDGNARVEFYNNSFTKRFTISGAGITTSGEPYVLRQNW